MNCVEAISGAKGTRNGFDPVGTQKQHLCSRKVKHTLSSRSSAAWWGFLPAAEALVEVALPLKATPRTWKPQGRASPKRIDARNKEVRHSLVYRNSQHILRGTTISESCFAGLS